jgi:hypothetical protein
MQRNRDRPPYVPLPGPGTVAPPVSDPRTQAPERERHCSGHTVHNHSLRVSRTGFSPATRTILVALTPSYTSAGFKSFKVTYQKSGLQNKRASTGADATARSTTQASSGRKNLLNSSGRTATPSGKTGAQSHTHLEKAAQTTLALAPDKWHNNEWKRHTHTLRSSC